MHLWNGGMISREVIWCGPFDLCSLHRLTALAVGQMQHCWSTCPPTLKAMSLLLSLRYATLTSMVNRQIHHLDSCDAALRTGQITLLLYSTSSAFAWHHCQLWQIMYGNHAFWLLGSQSKNLEWYQKEKEKDSGALFSFNKTCTLSILILFIKRMTWHIHSYIDKCWTEFCGRTGLVRLNPNITLTLKVTFVYWWQRVRGKWPAERVAHILWMRVTCNWGCLNVRMISRTHFQVFYFFIWPVVYIILNNRIVEGVFICMYMCMPSCRHPTCPSRSSLVMYLNTCMKTNTGKTIQIWLSLS